jgi:hypothetical protein
MVREPSTHIEVSVVDCVRRKQSCRLVEHCSLYWDRLARQLGKSSRQAKVSTWRKTEDGKGRWDVSPCLQVRSTRGVYDGIDPRLTREGPSACINMHWRVEGSSDRQVMGTRDDSIGHRL